MLNKMRVALKTYVYFIKKKPGKFMLNEQLAFRGYFAPTYPYQARRKQLQIGGGGGHTLQIGGAHINFFYFFLFFFLGGRGAYLCKLLGGGAAPTVPPPPIPTALPTSSKSCLSQVSAYCLLSL